MLQPDNCGLKGNKRDTVPTWVELSRGRTKVPKRSGGGADVVAEEVMQSAGFRALAMHADVRALVARSYQWPFTSALNLSRVAPSTAIAPAKHPLP